MTQILPKCDKQIVENPPVVPGQDLAKRHLGLFRRLGPNKAPAVRDPVDMGINADTWLSIGKRHHEVGSLASHSVDGEQLLQIIRDLAVVPLKQCSAYLLDAPRLGPVEPHRIDRPLDHASGKPEHGPRRPGQSEEALAGPVRGRILRAQAEQTPDERREGIFLVVADDWLFPLAHQALEDSDDLVNIPIGHHVGGKVSKARRCASTLVPSARTL